MKKGILLVLTGASSVGKRKIRDILMADKDLNLFYSISMTTRPKKDKEVDGEDYYFVNQKTFADAVKKHELLEFTEFDGYYYGTPREHIEFLISSGKNVLVEVEAQGVGQIKLHHPEAVSIFVMPKSIDDLKEQILLRYKDDEASAARRISKASVEMELAPLFKYIVSNEDAAKAAQEIKEVVLYKLSK